VGVGRAARDRPAERSAAAVSPQAVSPEAVGSAALGLGVRADATPWETDIGPIIGAATIGATATGTRGHTTATHTEVPAGGGHLRAVPGCAAAAPARTTATAIEVVRTTGAADTVVDRTVVSMGVGGTSADRLVQANSPAAELPESSR
jgi:hypothetical protein